MNKIDEYLENIKDNLCWKEIEELSNKLSVEINDIKYNLKKLEADQSVDEPSPDRIVAEDMLELGYPIKDVKKYMEEEWKYV